MFSLPSTPRNIAIVLAVIVGVAVVVTLTVIAVRMMLKKPSFSRRRRIRNWAPLGPAKSGAPAPVEPAITTIPPAVQALLMTSSWGSQILDVATQLGADGLPPSTTKAFPLPNTGSTASPYQSLVAGPYSDVILPCNDLPRAQLLAYLEAVYPLAIASQSLRRLSTTQLLALYRSLWYYFIVDANDQPDGNWDGPYWSKRIVPGKNPAINSSYPANQSPVSHSSSTGCTTTTAYANEAWLFDSTASHTWQWGLRIFVEPMQSSMRRGTRNWIANGQPSRYLDPRYGLGGYPSNAYVEMLWLPDEHSGGFPTGCSASAVISSKKVWAPKGYGGNTTDITKPLYQPLPPSQMPASYTVRPTLPHPVQEQRFVDTLSTGTYQPQTAVWFYQLPGCSMFWSTGTAAYTYSYIDTFINAPPGLGWTSSTQYPSDPSDKAGGMLGRDSYGDPKEIVQGDYVYNVKLILEYLSRTASPTACSGPSVNKPVTTDKNTQLPGLGFCICPKGAQPADCCAGTNCSASGASIGTSHSCDKQVAALMGVTSYWDDYGTTFPWSKSVVPTAKGPTYPTRRLGTTRRTDQRYLVCGWVNGNFYGYPTGDCMSCRKSNYQSATTCMQSTTITPPGKLPEWCENCNAFRGGVPGYDPTTQTICYGRHFTQDDALVYYDSKGDTIYETWFGKPLSLDEPTALALFAEFYSCGDCGWENSNVNWPFGVYFGFGQDLGGPGKNLWIQAAYANPGYGVNSVQFTMTPTSYSSQTTPAYDNELLYIPIAIGAEAGATCVSCVTLDIGHDTSELAQYAAPSKGSRGGYFAADSATVQNTAAPYVGTNLLVSNFTSLGTSTAPASFTVGQPNTFNHAITNVLNAATASGCSVQAPPSPPSSPSSSGAQMRLRRYRNYANPLVSYEQQQVQYTGPVHPGGRTWRAPGWH